MNMVESINEVVAIVKEIGALSLSINSDGVRVHVSKYENGLDKLFSEGFQLGLRTSSKNFPYEVCVIVDGIEFFELVTQQDIEKRFPQLTSKGSVVNG